MKKLSKNIKKICGKALNVFLWIGNIALLCFSIGICLYNFSYTKQSMFLGTSSLRNIGCLLIRKDSIEKKIKEYSPICGRLLMGGGIQAFTVFWEGFSICQYLTTMGIKEFSRFSNKIIGGGLLIWIVLNNTPKIRDAYKQSVRAVEQYWDKELKKDYGTSSNHTR